MTELLLLSLCLNSMNNAACSNAGTAYYKQSGDEKLISDYGQKLQNHYKQFSTEFIIIGATATFFTQHNYSTKLMSIKGVDVITSVGDTTGITLKRSY